MFMINLIEFNKKFYPEFQANGNASQFAIPFALQICEGKGVDIGSGTNSDWFFPNAIPIDKEIKSDSYHAMNIPSDLDYVYSSHCLEHLDSWIEAIEYWTKQLKIGGVLFLYLPHYSQEYWRPWNNRKHKHIIEGEHIYDLMVNLDYNKIYKSEVDLNNSFIIFGEKS